MTRLLVVFAVLVPAVAQAQVSLTAAGTSDPLTIATFDPENAIAPVSIIEGPGVKVGEGTVIHPVVGMETGVVSNVFYQSTDTQASGVLRVLAQVGMASLNQQRLNPNSTEDVPIDKGGFQYQASARLAYDQMLSGDEVVRNTGGLGAGALIRGMTNPLATWSFGFEDNYSRLIRAANFETNLDANRDINYANIALLYHPQGRTLSGYLYYQNMIDVFENAGDQYPDRMENRFGVHPMWKLFPETTLFGDFSWGVTQGIGSTTASMMKPTSYPLNTRLGIATLLSIKTSISIQAGYANGFYSAGPSFSAPTVDALLAYRYSPLGRVGVSYSWLYQDSVNANYYRDNVVRVFVQQAVDPLVFMVQPELHFREYNGVAIPGAPPVRDDTIFQVVAGVHYAFRNWIAATLDYKFSTVQTDFRYSDTKGDMVDPSFVRHELLLGVRAAM